MTGDIKELIARLEKATGPDRELADEILVQVFGWKRGLTELTEDFMLPPNSMEWLGPLKRPDPLSSIDAAMTLVPEGYYIEKRRYSDGWYVWISTHSTYRDDSKWNAIQTLEAIAICIASLRARADGGGE